jgi:hypothetical protein
MGGIRVTISGKVLESIFDVDYGSSLLGIFFAACPPEGLHALEQGILFRSFETMNALKANRD